jgi:hypothetical protein
LFFESYFAILIIEKILAWGKICWLIIQKEHTHSKVVRKEKKMKAYMVSIDGANYCVVESLTTDKGVTYNCLITEDGETIKYVTVDQDEYGQEDWNFVTDQAAIDDLTLLFDSILNPKDAELPITKDIG